MVLVDILVDILVDLLEDLIGGSYWWTNDYGILDCGGLESGTYGTVKHKLRSFKMIQ